MNKKRGWKTSILQMSFEYLFDKSILHVIDAFQPCFLFIFNFFHFFKRKSWKWIKNEVEKHRFYICHLRTYLANLSCSIDVFQSCFLFVFNFFAWKKWKKLKMNKKRGWKTSITCKIDLSNRYANDIYKIDVFQSRVSFIFNFFAWKNEKIENE